MSLPMNIGQAASAAGVSAKMVRHYESIGLVPAAARTESGYRQYTEQDVAVLRFIRQARGLGFSMEQIGELLGLWGNKRRASRTVKALAERHLAELEAKMLEMAQMQSALQALVASCSGDDHAHCAIIDGLASEPARSAAASPSRRAQRRGANPQRSSTARAADGAAAPDLLQASIMGWTRPARTPGR